MWELTLTAKLPKPADYPHNPKTLSLVLKKFCFDNNLTRAEVCRQIGLNSKNLWRWERGLRNVKGSNRSKIIQFLEKNRVNVKL